MSKMWLIAAARMMTKPNGLNIKKIPLFLEPMILDHIFLRSRMEPSCMVSHIV